MAGQSKTFGSVVMPAPYIMPMPVRLLTV